MTIRKYQIVEHDAQTNGELLIYSSDDLLQVEIILGVLRRTHAAACGVRFTYTIVQKG